MSRHQLTRQDDHATDKQGNEPATSQDLPAAAMVRQMLARGNPDPHAIAEIILAHPRSAHEIFRLIQQTLGNGFASQVSSLAVSHGGLGQPRDVATFDVSSEYQESRATIDHPHTVTEPAVDDGGYREDRATIDHPHAAKAESPWVERARRFNRAHPDNVRAFLDSTGTSCIDPEMGEPDPQKVARWQADHGVPPDGRIGDKTVQVAISDPSLAL